MFSSNWDASQSRELDKPEGQAWSDTGLYTETDLAIARETAGYKGGGGSV